MAWKQPFPAPLDHAARGRYASGMAGSLRFVVLHHTGVAENHFDFLFEADPGAMLSSFRTPRWPPTPGDLWEEADEHRRIYLDYQGLISGDRGSVARVDAGTITWHPLGQDPPAMSMALSREAGCDAHVHLLHERRLNDSRDTLWRVAQVR